jgi:hypothetical protein
VRCLNEAPTSAPPDLFFGLLAGDPEDGLAGQLAGAAVEDQIVREVSRDRIDDPAAHVRHSVRSTKSYLMDFESEGSVYLPSVLAPNLSIEHPMSPGTVAK